VVRYYYVREKEKMDIALADMFDGIIVLSYNDSSRTDYSRIRKIPLVLNSDPNFAQWWKNTQAAYPAMPMPIAGLRLTGYAPLAEERVQPAYMRGTYSRAAERWIEDISPTPVKYTYSLDILADTHSDSHQIIEQIMPYFNVDRALRIKEFDFAPDIERKVPVALTAVSQDIKDELTDNKKHKSITNKFTFELRGVMHRPFSIEEIIRYAELRVEMDNYNHVMQYIPIPKAIAEKNRRPWESLAPSIRDGYMILKNYATTLVKKVDDNGVVSWEDITMQVPDGFPENDCTCGGEECTCGSAGRPREVPEYNLMHFNFDENTPVDPTTGLMPEPDRSGFGRDFVAVDPNDVVFVPDLPPGNGKDSVAGWKPDPNIQWNNILDWFGTNKGENEDNFTFSSTLKFKESPPPDCLFQYLANNENPGPDGVTVIPAGEVYFEWGLTGQKLYFTYKTYGDNASFATFTTKTPLTLNNTDVYRFVFALYNKGASGMFGYSVGHDGQIVALETEKL
jgi:hypothetical protein